MSPATIPNTPSTPMTIAVPLSGFPSATKPFWRAHPALWAGMGAPKRPLTLRTMPIDIDIAHVARLARLGLSEEELEAYRAQLGVILEHAARVQSLDVEPGVEAAHPLGLENAFREDEVRPSLPRDLVLSQAPDSQEGHFVVPPAMEESE